VGIVQLKKISQEWKSPSIRQHPVASFQAVFFAKNASLRFYPAKPFGFFGHAKKFRFPNLKSMLHFSLFYTLMLVKNL